MPIVEAVGAAASRANNPELGKAVEAAMSKAVADCYAQGIMDPETIRARMLEAREQVKAAFNA